MLDAHAEGTMAAYLKRSGVNEHDGHASAKEMIAMLADDQEKISSTLSALCAVADKHGDWATNDLATARIEAHDKFAWMLRSHLRETA